MERRRVGNLSMKSLHYKGGCVCVGGGGEGEQGQWKERSACMHTCVRARSHARS